MPFEFKPAVRTRVSLLIGLPGASGSGKTLSALLLARGLAGGDDSKVCVIDTEAGRATHYAPAPGEPPGPTRFAFDHGDLRAPFSPDAYREAIEAADRAGYEVIVIDSMSHVWEGDGGVQDMHDQEVEAAAEKARSKGWDEDRARESASMGAWKEPKMRHKRMVSRLLQCRAHLIFCMRAEDRLRVETVTEHGKKKTIITQPKDLPISERWQPICEKRFPYELTLTLLVTPDAPGVPIPLKLQDQHRPFVPLDQPLAEEVGRRLAEWARGTAIDPAVAYAAKVDEMIEGATTVKELGEWWSETAPQRAQFDAAQRKTWQARVSARIGELKKLAEPASAQPADQPA